MATVAILNFGSNSILQLFCITWNTTHSYRTKFEGDISYRCQVKAFQKFQNGDGRHLEFWFKFEFTVFRTTWNTTHFYCTKFEGGISHRYQVIAFQSKSKWRQPPSWISDHLR